MPAATTATPPITATMSDGEEPGHAPIVRSAGQPVGLSRAARGVRRGLAAAGRRRSRRLLLGLDHHRDGLVDVVGDPEHLQVGSDDLAVGQHGVAEPVDQPGPVRRADQHDRERRDLLGLHQGQRLEQLVEGAEAAGQHDEALGVLHEHRLAGEEVAEVEPAVDVLVQAGLEGQLDAEPDRDAAGLAGALVGGLHDARAAAGDHREAGLDQLAAELLGRRRTTGRPACVRAEPNTEIAGPSSASAPKPSTNSLWIRSTRHGSVCTQSVGPAGVEQPLVGGARARPGRAASPCGPRNFSGTWPSSAPVTSRPPPSQVAQLALDGGDLRRAARTRPACAPGAGRPGRSSPPGRPAPLNRATSVQPNFGLAVPPTASTNAAAAGTRQPGHRRRGRVAELDLEAVEHLAHVGVGLARPTGPGRTGS